MSSDLSIDSLDNSLSEFYLAPPLNYSDWNGYQITWRDVPEIRSEVERRILQIYNSGNHVLALQLANLYFEQIYPRYEIQQVKSSKPGIFDSEENLGEWLKYAREFHDRLIEEQNVVLGEVGLIDPPPPLEPISETNYPALWAHQVYCLENGIALSTPKSHSGGLKEFWKEHKTAIIIAAVVIVVAVTVVVVIVTTGGTGTSIAVASGAAAAQAAIDDYNSSEDPNLQNLQYESNVNEGIQNFAKAIGATDVNNANGAITLIETNSISSKLTPEILTDLVSNWNQNLAMGKVAVATGEQSEIAFHSPILQPTIQHFTVNESTVSLGHPQVSNPLEQLDPQPMSLLPWVTEGISYLQWKERNYLEQLFKEFENMDSTSASNNVASAQSTPDEAHPKITNPSEWIELPQETRPRFNDRIVEDYLNDIERSPNRTKKNNFASRADHFFDSFQSPPPYPKMDLIGNLDQSTIHYHCGIGNSDSDIIEGGTCLYGTLGEEFAVQPHLIHSDRVGSGLGFVALEQIEKNQAQVRELQQGFYFREDDTLRLPQVILDYSNIQKSIDYEVENLSKIAQNIIKQGNPNLKQLHVTFSNGGYIFNEALKQLPSEYRETIIVVTTGTTKIVDYDSAHKVYNIIGDKDKGSQLCNGGLSGIEKAKDRTDVRVIPQTETQKWVGGHYFIQPNYQEAILDYLKDEVINKYEIY